MFNNIPVVVYICPECFHKGQGELTNSNIANFMHPKAGNLQDHTNFMEQNFNMMPDYIQSATKFNDKMDYFRQIVIQPNCVFINSRLNKVCSCCGLSLQNFLLQFDKGCAICFLEFKEEIIEYINTLVLRKEVMENQKVVIVDAKKEIIELEQKKQIAINNRNYIKAAEYRDKIKMLQTGDMDEKN